MTNLTVIYVRDLEEFKKSAGTAEIEKIQPMSAITGIKVIERKETLTKINAKWVMVNGGNITTCWNDGKVTSSIKPGRIKHG